MFSRGNVDTIRGSWYLEPNKLPRAIQKCYDQFLEKFIISGLLHVGLNGVIAQPRIPNLNNMPSSDIYSIYIYI